MTFRDLVTVVTDTGSAPLSVCHAVTRNLFPGTSPTYADWQAAGIRVSVQ